MRALEAVNGRSKCDVMPVEIAKGANVGQSGTNFVPILQMSFEIHPMVQDANDQDFIIARTIEDNMRLLPYSAKPRRDLTGAAAQQWIAG